MANDRIRPFSLVRLSFIAIGVFALSSVLAVTALLGVQDSSQKSVFAWRQFSDQASAEQRALRAFVTQAGLAGLIDDYYRLAATGDQALVPTVYGRGGGALGALAAYPVDDASESEVKARATLQALIRDYMTRVGPIMAMHAAGRPVAEILRASDVDGAQAVPALQTLAGATAHSMMADNTPADSKSMILLDIRRLLGIEGLVQNANRFLIHADASLNAVRVDISEVRAAIERYGHHSLTADETVALAALRQQIDAVESQLTAAKTAGVHIFDARKLQATLTDLEKLVYAEALAAQQNLQSTLGEVSDRAGTIIVLVAVGALILIVGGVWLLVFRIGRRIKAITGVMRDLAGGNLDADIPAAHDRDEIGDMSRALLVFRDGLRANAALTTELAESSRLASLGAMVAGMAHELNTPIGNALVVSSNLEDQCRDFRKDLGAERISRSTLDRHVSTLEDASTLIQRNLVRAADQIGSFKQFAVDQTSGKRRQFFLDDVLASVVQSMQPQFKRSPFTLKLGEASGVTMESYPGALSQVVTNLVENGLKHGLAGRETGEIEVSVRRIGPHVTEIIVVDDGVGVPDDIKASIFNAFFTTKAGKGGSGLGLHIVRSIVCGPLGGQISVLSRPEGGSRFIISLPNKAPAEGTAVSSTERTYYATAQHAA
jgi:signal transduction histidine kinase